MCENRHLAPILHRPVLANAWQVGLLGFAGSTTGSGTLVGGGGGGAEMSSSSEVDSEEESVSDESLPLPLCVLFAVPTDVERLRLLADVGVLESSFFVNGVLFGFPD